MKTIPKFLGLFLGAVLLLQACNGPSSPPANGTGSGKNPAITAKAGTVARVIYFTSPT